MDAIYIDDTGTPQKSKSKYDPGNWKSWVAVVVNHKQRQEISLLIRQLKIELNKKWKITEFHFTDIFSGEKEFKEVDLDTRINLFYKFAEIYRYYRCPVVIQSLNDDDVIRNKMTDLRKFKPSGFDLSDNEQFCLWILLIRLKNDSTITENYKLPLEILVDTARKQHNTLQKTIEVKDFAVNSQIRYIDSHSDELMQFIDFIAFCLNRHRWILMNDKKSESDKLIMQITHYANFKSNLQRKLVNFDEEHTSQAYDNFLRKKFDENKNLTDEEVEKIKKNKG